jgi:hypothetical protein
LFSIVIDWFERCIKPLVGDYENNIADDAASKSSDGGAFILGLCSLLFTVSLQIQIMQQYGI